MNITRRNLLLAFGATALANGAFAQGQSDLRRNTRLVLLGTMAGPVLNSARVMASQVLFVNGRAYMIDCGYGAVARMTELGIRPPEIAAVFITHHHSDHNADYASLINMAWVQTITGQMNVIGPPPMLRIHESAIALQREDIDIRIKATGRPAIEKSFAVREIGEAGVVYTDDRVKVTSVLVDHAPFTVALGYRFDTADSSIVFSGDTGPSAALTALAKGADTLVHEAMYVPGIEAMLAKRSYVPPYLRQFLLKGHTTAEDAGRVAAAAGVRRLVLTHLLPGDEGIPDEVWRAEAAKHFKGEIVVGKDKMIL